MWIAQAGYVPVLAHVLPPRAGPRCRPHVGESGLGLIAGHAHAAPSADEPLAGK